MKLIVISHPDHFEQEAEIINNLFELGLNHFHLRKPGWSTKEIAKLLEDIHPEFHERIVIHDHFQLAMDYGLGGIHFTGKTKDLMARWISFKGRQSTSCHKLQELEQLPEQIDYAFLSPIFPSISKNGYSAKWDEAELKEFLQAKSPADVIALGGITPGNIGDCLHLGFGGIAVLGRVWTENASTTDVTSNFQQLQAAMAALHSIIKK